MKTHFNTHNKHSPCKSDSQMCIKQIAFLNTRKQFLFDFLSSCHPLRKETFCYKCLITWECSSCSFFIYVKSEYMHLLWYSILPSCLQIMVDISYTVKLKRGSKIFQNICGLHQFLIAISLRLNKVYLYITSELFQ